MLQEAGEIRVQAVRATVKMDLFKIGDQLTELPEIEEDDFAGPPFCSYPLLPDGHSFKQIKINSLQEKLVVATQRYAFQDALEELDTGSYIRFRQPWESVSNRLS